LGSSHGPVNSGLRGRWCQAPLTPLGAPLHVSAPSSSVARRTCGLAVSRALRVSAWILCLVVRWLPVVASRLPLVLLVFFSRGLLRLLNIQLGKMYPLALSYGRSGTSSRGPSQADRCLGQSNAEKEKRPIVRLGLSTCWRNDNSKQNIALVPISSSLQMKIFGYSRSPKNPALQQFQTCSKSAYVGS